MSRKDQDNNKISKNRRNFLKLTALSPLIFTTCDNKYKIIREPVYTKTKKAILFNSRCPLCNIGCKINVNLSNDEYKNRKTLESVNPIYDPSYYLSGILCIKGITIKETLYSNRLTTPIIDKKTYDKYKEWKNQNDDISIKYNQLDNETKAFRDKTLGYNSTKSKNRDFMKISIEETIDIITAKTTYTMQKYSSEEVYTYSSSSLGIESHYAINKFMRGLLSSPNLNTDLRLRDFSSSKALKDSTGSYLSNIIFRDVFTSDLVIMSGTNLRSSSPVFFWKYLEHIKASDTTNIIFDPRETSTIIELKETRLANTRYKEEQFGHSSAVRNKEGEPKGNVYHLSLIDTDFYAVNAIAYFIITEYPQALDTDFISNYTNTYNDYKEYILNNHSPDKTQNIHKIYISLLRLCAKEISQASIIGRETGKGGITWLTGSGISENFYGYETIRSIVSLLSITGNLYRKGSGILPIKNLGNTYAQYLSGNNKDILLSGISLRELKEDYRLKHWSFTKGYNNIPYSNVIASIWGIEPGQLNTIINKKSKDFIHTFMNNTNQNKSTAFIFNSQIPLIPNYDIMSLDKCFTVMFDYYNDSMNIDFADIVLPCSQFGETTETGINIDRELFIRPNILQDKSNPSIPEYLNKISNRLSKILDKSSFKLSKTDKDINKTLYKELAELTRGTEFELPIDIYKNPDIDYRIPYRRTSMDEYRFMFPDNKDRRRFYKGYRNPNGKIDLSIHNNDTISIKSDKSEKNEINITDIIKEINFKADEITDNIVLTKIKSDEVLLKTVHDDFSKSNLKEIKANDKYPLWLVLGSVYEHYRIDLTNRSSLISEWIDVPYIEMSNDLINMYNLNEGEKVYVVTPIGRIIASISLHNGKIRPGRNKVMDNMVFAPYNILFNKTINTKDKISPNKLIKPIKDPITDTYVWKSPCRIEYI